MASQKGSLTLFSNGQRKADGRHMVAALHKVKKLRSDPKAHEQFLVNPSYRETPALRRGRQVAGHVPRGANATL